MAYFWDLGHPLPIAPIMHHHQTGDTSSKLDKTFMAAMPSTKTQKPGKVKNDDKKKEKLKDDVGSDKPTVNITKMTSTTIISNNEEDAESSTSTSESSEREKTKTDASRASPASKDAKSISEFGNLETEKLSDESSKLSLKPKSKSETLVSDSVKIVSKDETER